MGGGGSIQGMIVSLRNNKKLLRKRNPFRRNVGYEKLRKDYIKFSKGRIESEALSNDELKKIRDRVITENRKEIIIKYLLVTFIFCISVYIGYLVYDDFVDNQRKQEELILAKNSEKYLFYIKDGDKWLEQKNWNNAIFQYLLAKEIFPNEYDVNYRLALAFGSKCKFKQSGCQNGTDILTKLKKQFPEKTELGAIDKLLD